MGSTSLQEQAWLDQGEGFLRPNFDDRVQTMDDALRIIKTEEEFRDPADHLAALQFIVDNELGGKLDTDTNEAIAHYTGTGELWN
jgi:hypothetical protein